MPKVPKALETQEQIAFVTLCRLKYPKLLFFAIPNGGYRTMITGRILQREGLIPGVPDLFFPALRTFIEMKRADKSKSRVSQAQKHVIKLLEQAEYTCFVAYGAQHALNYIDVAMKNRQPNGLPVKSEE